MNSNFFNDYLRNENSICREERQYAVLLYNCLRGMKGNGLKINDEKLKNLKEELFGKEPINIEYVFYEATFMRDFFYEDRKKSKEQRDKDKKNRFNMRLSCYLEMLKNDLMHDEKLEDCENLKSMLYAWKHDENKIAEVLDSHLGMLRAEKRKHVFENEEEGNILKLLMNSKPDIAVIYSKKINNEIKKYLQFFECKFESEETKPYGIQQTKTQDLIAGFLTWDENKIADSYEKTKLIRFVRKNQNEMIARRNKDIVEVSIDYLISYSD